MVHNYKDLEESIVSTIKAITEINKITVDFELETENFMVNFAAINQNSFSKNKISLPKITSGNIEKSRAFADLATIYLKFHNKKIHQQNLENAQSQQLFDNLEKFRLIKQGCEEFKGIEVNLEKMLSENLEAINDYSFLPFLLLETPTLQAKINGYKKLIGRELLTKINQLSELTSNQKSFASKALDLIEFLNNQNQEKEKQQEEQSKSESKEKPQPQNQESNNAENIEQEIQIDQSLSTAQSDENKEAKVFESTEQEIYSDNEIEDLSSNKSKIKFVPEYKIFTKKFDQITRASDLINPADLENLRNQLDLKLEKLDRISKQLTGKLKRKLLAKKQIFFEFNKEEGLLDRKKMSQIIAKPNVGNNYLTIREDDYQNTVLSILLDNSGSMRGTPIVMSAMAAEIIAKIFEGFGIKTEILGFTTVDWRGGKSRKLWEEQGKPKNPGRLSDLRHIIYKNADQSFKKSKNNLALMLKDGILKENIDGEALIWASTRLKNRSEKRRILLIISDGTPVDDSTNSNNDNDILNDHLHQTIHRLEKHSKIEIAAIGIGHNVGDFYHNSITVKNIDELGDVMINKICQIL
jgi:cobaltochelatase CobT